MYRDATELPQRVATTGRELIEDIQAGRKLRALAPIEAIGHAIGNASREDVQRLAHAVVDGAIAFYHKPAYEKGEALGHATVSVASEVAIAVATDGLGNLATLRKAEKVADVAEHVRDAERAAAAAVRKPSLERASRGKNHLVPDPHAEGPHTTFRRSQDGEISNFTEWKNNPRNPSGFDEAKRVDVTGGSHWNAQMQQDIPTPHVHDRNAVGGVRSARADEIPIRLKQGK